MAPKALYLRDARLLDWDVLLGLHIAKALFAICNGCFSPQIKSEIKARVRCCTQVVLRSAERSEVPRHTARFSVVIEDGEGFPGWVNQYFKVLSAQT